MTQPRDTGELLAVPEDQRLDVDPDPADVGELNDDAYTDPLSEYDVPVGEDVPFDDEEEPA